MSAQDQLRTLFLGRRGQVYVFRVDEDEASRLALFATLRRWAQDRELKFTWHDAVVVLELVRANRSDRGQATASGGEPVGPNRLKG